MKIHLFKCITLARARTVCARDRAELSARHIQKKRIRIFNEMLLGASVETQKKTREKENLRSFTNSTENNEIYIVKSCWYIQIVREKCLWSCKCHSSRRRRWIIDMQWVKSTFFVKRQFGIKFQLIFIFAMVLYGFCFGFLSELSDWTVLHSFFLYTFASKCIESSVVRAWFVFSFQVWNSRWLYIGISVYINVATQEWYSVFGFRLGWCCVLRWHNSPRCIVPSFVYLFLVYVLYASVIVSIVFIQRLRECFHTTAYTIRHSL